VNNHHLDRHLTQDQINSAAHEQVDNFFESNDKFILPEDPLFKYDPVYLPHRKCQCCDHDKFFLEYHYKRWDTGKKRLSHFGLLRCDKCGSAITWVNGDLRDALIERNNINIAEID
jgi:hypothetical protein|tara:strand:+ start:569 stop:916 length:348 start_codon:yes stop_codon:yes gene_type:complete